MLKDIIFNKDFKKENLTKIEKLVLAYEILEEKEITTAEEEKAILNDLKKDKEFLKNFENYTKLLLEDLKQKYNSIKNLIED